jgi:hypothetical protein
MTAAEMQKRIAELEAQVAKKSTLTAKASEKGAVSVYGLGRFPVTLYPEQWLRLLEWAPKTIPAFIEANKSKLKFKE